MLPEIHHSAKVVTLDSLFTFRLSTGQVVAVSSIDCKCTYAGVMEGSRATVSRYLLRELENDSRPSPTLLVGARMPLPEVQCEAFLTSGASRGLASHLRVVWWLPQLPDSLQQAVSVLTDIDWDSHARTYEPFDF